MWFLNLKDRGCFEIEIISNEDHILQVYAKAKECVAVISMEEFGVLLGKHFVKTYPEVLNGCFPFVNVMLHLCFVFSQYDF